MFRIAVLVLLFLIQLGCQAASVVESGHDFSAVDAAMAEAIAKKRISGGVTLIMHEGKRVHLGVTGHADIVAEKPMKADSIFWIASMTKPITATAVLMLQDAGKLSVDDPVSKYLPEFKDVTLKDGSAATIRIRDLMTHTAGIGKPKNRAAALADQAKDVAGQPLSWKPATKWQYSQGLNVCGRIIEVVTGEPYDVYLKKTIFDPLGMEDTSFFPTPAQGPRIVLTYVPSKDKKGIVPSDEERLVEPPKTKPVPNPSGGLFSTAADVATFYQMVLAGGVHKGKRIVSQGAVKRMTTRQTADDVVTGFTPGNGWGLGWCVVRKPQGVSAALSPGSFGHGGAFGTQVWCDPVTKTIYLLMIQRARFGNSDASEIRGRFQDLAKAALQSP
ncbi:MAG: CubicO group peptidase (beta-lactamase class C family) [Rhodothermales bacterium]|jgi:CubicO group peptidase (beta-lactamase class C family)